MGSGPHMLQSVSSSKKITVTPMGDDVTLPIKAIKKILGSLNFGAEIPQVNARI